MPEPILPLHRAAELDAAGRRAALWRAPIGAFWARVQPLVLAAAGVAASDFVVVSHPDPLWLVTAGRSRPGPSRLLAHWRAAMALDN